MSYGQVNADVIGTSVANSSLGAGNATLMKNKIINGACVIDQRNAGASVTPTTTGTNVYTLDRWAVQLSQASKFSVQQNAGSVTPPVGFTKYLGITSLSAYSVTSSDYFLLTQPIEGFNIADLGWGTANAKTVTLSFQVYSSLTGTFGATLMNDARNRSYPFTYTISSANTWTTISVTIAGDTTGTWRTDNGVGINIWFGLGVGSNFNGTAGSWSGNAYYGATGATSVVGTNGATFYITGVQLEVGSSATGYEYRQYGQELALCQRYYYQSWGISGNTPSSSGNAWAGLSINTTEAYGTTTFPVSMRSAPTVTNYDQAGASGKVSSPGVANGLSGTPTNISVNGFNYFTGSGYTATKCIISNYLASAEL